MVLATKTHVDLVKTLDEINEELNKELAPRIDKWGYEAISFELGHRSADEQTAQLTQLPARVKAMRDALGLSENVDMRQYAFLVAAFNGQTTLNGSVDAGLNVSVAGNGNGHAQHNGNGHHHTNGDGMFPQEMSP
jgi:hypothetical protein